MKRCIYSLLKNTFKLNTSNIIVIIDNIKNKVDLNKFYILLTVFRIYDISSDFLYNMFTVYINNEINTIIEIINLCILNKPQILSLIVLNKINIKLIHKLICGLIKTNHAEYVSYTYEIFSNLTEYQACKYIHLSAELDGKIDYITAYNLIVCLNDEQLRIFIQHKKNNLNYLDCYCLALGINLEIF